MDLDDEGRKTGSWEEPDPHGGIISGDYVAGERHGMWRHHFTDGSVRSECHYVHGALTGECVWFRQGGALLQTGAFLDGEKQGLWKRWTSAGILIDEGHFDRGAKSGTWTHYAPDCSITKITAHRGKA
jgi:antitoxin component YwqK of YwqJK toxin-antitoxin module